MFRVVAAGSFILSIGLRVWFFSIAMWLWFCNVVWDQVLWYIQHHCPGLLSLFGSLLCFYMDFWIIFSNFIKNVIEILVEITLNYRFLSMTLSIFTVLILTVREKGGLPKLLGLEFLQCFKVFIIEDL